MSTRRKIPTSQPQRLQKEYLSILGIASGSTSNLGPIGRITGFSQLRATSNERQATISPPRLVP